MHQSLDYFIFNRYPHFFINTSTNSKFLGFSCDDGWFHILNSMFLSIDNHIKFIQQTNNSYNKVIADIKSGKDVSVYWRNRFENNELGIVEVPVFSVQQIKEKFGTLRCHYIGGDSYISGVVSNATNMSLCTCEKCGSPGTLRNIGWIKTLCEKHYKESLGENNQVVPSLFHEFKLGDRIDALFQGMVSPFTITEIKSDYFIAQDYEKSTDLYQIYHKPSPVFSFFEATKLV